MSNFPLLTFLHKITPLSPSRLDSNGGGGADEEAEEDRLPLANVITSFKFPGAGDEISSYSRWNWRVMGSLMLDLTFHGDFNIPGGLNATTREDAAAAAGGMLQDEAADAEQGNATNR